MKFFNPVIHNKNVSIKDFYEIKNKICIVRSSGGLGDIVHMRMIFQDLKLKYPQFHVTWAIPHGYKDAGANHPYVDNLIDYQGINLKEYLKIYNLTNACTKYEWRLGKDNDKNRADIWANHVGYNLDHANTFMPNYDCYFTNIRKKLLKLGWNGDKKIIALAPKSALATKNLTFEICKKIKNLTERYFVFAIHNAPIIEMSELKIPVFCGDTLAESMASIQMSDGVITTDTGHMHIAGGYGKPTMAIFCYTNGKIITKHYPSVHVVQKHFDEFPEWCGPCNNSNNCHKTKLIPKPCMEEITEEMLYNCWENVEKLLNI